MQKSADAFRTISEVADDLSLPQHVLRFWETRFSQIRPLKRAGGRRYYRPADISLLKAIRQLLYDDGYTIKGVQRLLKEQGARGLSSGAQAEVDWDGAVVSGANGELLEDPETLHEADEDGSGLNGSRGATGHSQRAALVEALATVEECKRILDALLTAPR